MVLDDIYNTAVCLTLRGQVEPDEFKLLQEGVARVRGFIHSEVYNIDSAIVNAAKAAYLAKLIEKGISTVNHYDSSNLTELATATLAAPIPTKFNKLKKSNTEAFFYWNEIQNLPI